MIEATLIIQPNKFFTTQRNESTLPVLFSHSTLREELKQLIDSHTSLERMTIATHNGTMNNKLFLNNETYFTSSDLLPNQTNFSKNVSFFLEDISNIKKIDYLACNSLSYDDWKSYYALLRNKSNLQLQIGASDDFTGNMHAGGDWVMENTQENIQTIYFNGINYKL